MKRALQKQRLLLYLTAHSFFHLGEARVGADRVESGLIVQQHQELGTLVEGLIEPGESRGAVGQGNVVVEYDDTLLQATRISVDF